MAKRLIFFTMLELDNNVYQSVEGEINYLKEAVLCFNSLRTKYPKSDNNIKIICYNPGSIDIPSSKKDTFKELGVEYIHQPLENRNTHCSWYNVPKIGMKLEKQYPNDILVHIDLDMFMVKHIPDTYLNVKSNEVKIATYSSTSLKPHIACTCFIVSYGKSKFYSIWDSYLLMFADMLSPESDYKGYCDLEEGIIDIMYHEDMFNISLINDEFMLGNAYSQVATRDTIFIHAHYNQGKEKYIKAYLKYLERKLHVQ